MDTEWGWISLVIALLDKVLQIPVPIGFVRAYEQVDKILTNTH